jgi:hypothetical protein
VNTPKNQGPDGKKSPIVITKRIPGKHSFERPNGTMSSGRFSNLPRRMIILMPEDVRMLFFRFFLLSDGLDSGFDTLRPIGTADTVVVFCDRTQGLVFLLGGCQLIH